MTASSTASERVATDVTDADGRYLFEDLPRATTSCASRRETGLDGWYVGGTQLAGVPVTAAGNKTDNDNNAVPDASTAAATRPAS